MDLADLVYTIPDIFEDFFFLTANERFYPKPLIITSVKWPQKAHWPSRGYTKIYIPHQRNTFYLISILLQYTNAEPEARTLFLSVLSIIYIYLSLLGNDASCVDWFAFSPHLGLFLKLLVMGFISIMRGRMMEALILSPYNTYVINFSVLWTIAWRNPDDVSRE